MSGLLGPALDVAPAPDLVGGALDTGEPERRVVQAVERLAVLVGRRRGGGQTQSGREERPGAADSGQ